MAKIPEYDQETAEVYTENDIGISGDKLSEIEEDTLEKVNKAMIKIENAIAVWDNSKIKPKDLMPRIARLKSFHEMLTEWSKKMLKNRGKNDIDYRMSMLRQFVEICYRYENA